MRNASLSFGLLCGAALCAQTNLRYIENKGQWPAPVRFKAEAPGATIWVENGAILLDRYDAQAVARLNAAHAGHADPDASPVIRHHAVRLRFIGANGPARIEKEGPSNDYFNYFLGADRTHWAARCHAWSRITMKDLYPGVDLVIHGQGQQVKYDLVLEPGVDPSVIAFTYEGADALELRGKDLVVKTALGDLLETIPAITFPVPFSGGVSVMEIEGHYVIEQGKVSIRIPGLPKNVRTTIDPTLSFSTYSGSTSDNFGYTATFDNDGFLFSGSSAFGQGYPTTIGAYDTSHNGGDGLGDGTDIAITKYDTTGTYLRWSTFLGGGGDDLPHSLITNGADEVFVLGSTSSTAFPTTTGAYDTGWNGGTAFSPGGLGVNYVNGSDMIVARLSADGTQLLASTYVGGSQNDGLNTSTALKFNYADEIRGEILLDANDNVYVISTTQSADFPTTSGCYQPAFAGGTHDGVAFKMDAALGTLIWSTFFGGSTADAAYAGELDDDNNLYICGGTNSTDLPTTSGAVQPGFQGGTADAFVALLANDGTALLNATYWGSGAYDQSYFVEADNAGSIYLFGQTAAPSGELISSAPYNLPNGGQFLSKLSPDLGASVWSSRFGNGSGQPNISPTAFLVDYCRKIYVAGWGSNIGIGLALSTAGMEVTPDAYQPTTDGNDFYIGVFDIDMLDLYYATFFGGSVSHEHVDGGTSRFDRRGRIYESVCAGCGGNSDFPSTPGAWSPTNNSPNCNNGVFKFDFDFPIVVAGFSTDLACLPSPIAFNNSSYGATNYFWTFGDGGTSIFPEPTHVYPAPGVYTVTLVASNAASCNVADTMVQQVVVLGNGAYALPDTSVCAGNTVQIGLLPIADPGITYQWSPATGLSSTTVANPFATPPSDLNYTLIISNGLCTDTVSQFVDVADATVDAGNDTTVCGPGPVAVTLTANGFGTTDAFQWSSSPLFTDQLNPSTADSTLTLGIDGDAVFFVRPLGVDCGGYDSVHVHVELLDPALDGDAFICADEVAALTLTGIDAGSSIVWAPADEIDSGQGTTIATTTPGETTAYTATVTGPTGCIWSGGALVTVSPVNGADVNASVDQPIVLAGETVHLFATPTTGVTYSWTPADAVSDPGIADPTAVIEETTTFYVTVSDGICTRIDSVTVRVFEFNCDEPDVFVPNAFTPNGDGNNDVLYVRGRFIASMLFRVFDRWGEKVFETTDQSNGWDGTYKDKEVDPAVFVWYLDVTCGDGQTLFLKGNTTVIR